MEYTNKAVNDGLLEIIRKNGKQHISYVSAEKSRIYDNPEEKVRAEYWSELVYRYGYKPENIEIEVTIPDRVDKDRVDIVVYTDSGKKQPYAIVECKREGITDTEFTQAIEQAFGNAAWVKFNAKYVSVIAGNTRRFFDMSNFEVLEREKNIIADIPKQYGKPLEYKYYKGGDLDIKEVSKSELMSAIKKCHQTLWGGKVRPLNSI